MPRSTLGYATKLAARQSASMRPRRNAAEYGDTMSKRTHFEQ